MTDFTPLDNPTWHALSTAHRSLALSNGLARRYEADVSPLAGLKEPTPRAFADLRALVGAGGQVGLFTARPIDVPGDWHVVRNRVIDQMVCTELPHGSTASLLELRENDIPEMLALTAVAQPGPFLPRTIQMGRYYGIRNDDGRLISMAGERLRLEAFTEISAVCTDPAFRGRGHARVIINTLVRRALENSRIPFLHVKTENAAKAVYERLGFSVRSAIQVTVIVPV